MGVAIFDILRENGANWVNCTGDFTKKVTLDGVQIFVTLSPDGTELISCFPSLHSSNAFSIVHLQSIPTGLTIPEEVPYNEIVLKMQRHCPWLKANNIFLLKSRYNKRLAFTCLNACETIFIYGVLNGKDYFIGDNWVVS